MNLYTVASEELIRIAARIEADARDQQVSWIILGQTEKFSAEMDRAAVLRAAANIRGIAARRQMLVENGYTFNKAVA